MSQKPINRKWLIRLLVIIFVLLLGFITGLLVNNVNLFKSDTQKWDEFKPILKKDAEAYNNFQVKSEDVAKKHYPIIKNIDCNNLNNFKDKEECSGYQKITIKEIERPNEVKKNVVGNYSEYQVYLSSIQNI